MATTRPLAYNTGSSISGTTQVGDLAVGTTDQDYGTSPGGIPWWMGPDEDLGYVIAIPVSGNTQPTSIPNIPAPTGEMQCSTIYKGANINLSNNNQTAFQQFGYQMSVLTNTFINKNDKVMFSVLSTSLEPLTLPQSRFVGVGKTTMNYQGSPYGGYPGNDTQSIGINAIGEYYYNGSVVQSGLPTWTQGDIIDIAISHGQYWWIRVNGGNWNNDPSANPATNSNGLLMNGLVNYYPVLCPGYEGTMTIQNGDTYGVPEGFTLLGVNVNSSVGFFRTKTLTDNAFISLSEYVASKNGTPQTFTTASNASTWLTNNGFWNTYVAPVLPSEFISTWTVINSKNPSITLPYSPTGTYSGTIDWGDGSTSVNSYANQTHAYASNGDYTITISGVTNGFSFGVDSTSSYLINEILQWGNLNLGNDGGYFKLCENLELSGVTDTLNLDGTTNLSEMFYACSSITSINNITSWDVSNVTDMNNMFQGTSQFNQPIGNWDVSNVVYMYGMFSSCYSFNQPLSGWNVSNVIDMSYMFAGTSFNQPIGNWITSGVTSMSGMFSNSNSSNSFNQPIENWDVSNVTEMGGMFSNGIAFNQPLSGWNVSNVTNMRFMFNGATSFNRPIGDWSINNVSIFVNFMGDKTPLTFSASNLDDIYNKWSLESPQSGLNISFGSAQYTSAGQTGRDILTGTYGWTITDGGSV